MQVAVISLSTLRKVVEKEMDLISGGEGCAWACLYGFEQANYLHARKTPLDEKQVTGSIHSSNRWPIYTVSGSI